MIGGVSFSELHYFVYMHMLGSSQVQSEFSSTGETSFWDFGFSSLITFWTLFSAER